MAIDDEGRGALSHDEGRASHRETRLIETHADLIETFIKERQQ